MLSRLKSRRLSSVHSWMSVVALSRPPSRPTLSNGCPSVRSLLPPRRFFSSSGPQGGWFDKLINFVEKVETNLGIPPEKSSSSSSSSSSSFASSSSSSSRRSRRGRSETAKTGSAGEGERVDARAAIVLSAEARKALVQCDHQVALSKGLTALQLLQSQTPVDKAQMQTTLQTVAQAQTFVAWKADDQEQFEEAVARGEEALELGPTSPEFELRMAQWHHKLKNYTRAVALGEAGWPRLRQALPAENPWLADKSRMLLCGAAVLVSSHSRLGDFSRGVLVVEVANPPSISEFLRQLDAADARASNPQEVKSAALDREVVLGGLHLYYLFAAGCFSALNMHQEAIGYYEHGMESVRADKNFPKEFLINRLRGLGGLYMTAGRDQDARAAVAEALELGFDARAAVAEALKSGFGGEAKE